jgi:DNA primase
VQRISDRIERMAVANDLAGYVGVEPGLILDTFKKAAGDLRERSIAAPKIAARPDEKGLIHVLLSGDETAGELAQAACSLSTLGALETRRILQAAGAVHASGAAITVEAVSARLEENDRQLLAAIVFAEESELAEPNAAYGWLCIESLRRGAQQQIRAQLKAKINEVERTGNWQEAMRLMRELQAMDARDSPAQGTVQ